MQFTAILEKFDSNLWGHHMVVPNDIAQSFLNKGDRRVICTLNDTIEFQCALMPKGDGTYFININKELRKKLGIGIGSQVQVQLKKDDSKYGLPMPEELSELLKIDDEGNRFFHSLTPGKQRNLLHIIGSPKTSDTRLRKAIVVIDYLKSTSGKLNFKELNEAFKRENQR
ncbi:MAG: DUF1905 domain-containing protein [Bacteroidetes bacterium]|nr:DUF1905 domain-containing protein [Bacteroidota bacterium]